MATFDDATVGCTTAVSFAATGTQTPNIRTTRMGDGYEQRVEFGLNPSPKTWDIVFKNRTDVDRDKILAFLQERNGKESFDWMDPQQSTMSAGSSFKRYKCREWTYEMLAFNVNDISVTFEQVFEP